MIKTIHGCPAIMHEADAPASFPRMIANQRTITLTAAGLTDARLHALVVLAGSVHPQLQLEVEGHPRVHYPGGLPVAKRSPSLRFNFRVGGLISRLAIAAAGPHGI